jgi:uncharacterized membrane protein
LTALLVALLYQLTVNRSSVIPYDMMEDTLGSAPIEDIFRFSVIAGSIGAIMDVAVAIHASVDKMAADGTLPEGRALRASLREIGGDVMGTMINVLFFSYISASLPICVLKIASGYAVTSIFNYDLIFDFTRFLLGAIGIVLTIPVSEGVALAIAGGNGGAGHDSADFDGAAAGADDRRGRRAGRVVLRPADLQPAAMAALARRC